MSKIILKLLLVTLSIGNLRSYNIATFSQHQQFVKVPKLELKNVLRERREMENLSVNFWAMTITYENDLAILEMGNIRVGVQLGPYCSLGNEKSQDLINIPWSTSRWNHIMCVFTKSEIKLISDDFIKAYASSFEIVSCLYLGIQQTNFPG